MSKNINKDENDIYHFEAYLRKIDTDGFDPMSTYNNFFKDIGCEINGRMYKFKLKTNVSYLNSLDISETFSFLSYLQKKIQDMPLKFEAELEFNEVTLDKYLQGRCFYENKDGNKEPFENLVTKIFYEYSKSQKQYKPQIIKKVETINNLDYLDIIINNKKYKFKLNLFNTSYHKMNKPEKKALTDYVREVLFNADEISVEPHMSISGNILGDLKVKTKDGSFSLEKNIKKLIDDDPTKDYEFNYLDDGIKLEALVSKVIDGDTIKIYKNGQRKNIRLANIDAPEMGQEYGQASKDHLVNLIGKNKHVHIFINNDIGKYKRLVATIDNKPVFSSMKDSINRRMVADGMAYSASKTNLFQNEEDEADIYDKGLWFGKPAKRDNPANFRKEKKLEKFRKSFTKFGKK